MELFFQPKYLLTLAVVLSSVSFVYSEGDVEGWREQGSEDSCGQLSNLGSGCSVNSDCTKITCAVDGIVKTHKTTVTIKINKCDEPVTYDVSVKTDDLGIDWTHNFPADAVVEVPGFSLGSMIGVYIKVQILDTGSNLHLKIQVLVGSKATSLYFFKATLIDSNLPTSTWECGIVRWFEKLSLAAKISLIAAGPVLLIASCICCCCCCCRRRSSSPGVVMMHGGPTVVTSTITNVPAKTLVNEQPMVEFA
ncbi:predicted protein [Nematostella vectensis]|uniref:Uncharacterized protein n=1 Tax=Nematostella vectensis TaxID=45351 RepID=A7SFP3_NEMVE|nr:predicted protein [Nematostella vectensis]|eukprot:XP_001629564.1 predicted protein [Nematostella vectensis]